MKRCYVDPGRSLLVRLRQSRRRIRSKIRVFHHKTLEPRFTLDLLMDRHTHAENVDVSNTIHQAGRQAPYIIFSFIGYTMHWHQQRAGELKQKKIRPDRLAPFFCIGVYIYTWRWVNILQRLLFNQKLYRLLTSSIGIWLLNYEFRKRWIKPNFISNFLLECILNCFRLSIG